MPAEKGRNAALTQEPDPDNTGVGNAFLLLDTVGRWTRWQGGCFPDEKHPFYFAQGSVKVEDRLCASAEFSFAITGE